jgi:isoquinoline 1-oxidoreductase alpha subunit
MTASALLARTPNPTDEQITNAMNGNLCRCATYNRIRAGIKAAAAMPRTSSPTGTPGESPDQLGS